MSVGRYTPTAADIGKKYGRLTVLAREKTDGVIRFRCRCDCGRVITVRTGKLRNGHTRSCGCLQSEQTRVRNTTHGLSRTPTHTCYRAMVNRCTNPRSADFRHYGGRGITVDPAWLGPAGFANFLADMGERPERMWIDRIDNDRGYGPGNCRWATPTDQQRNKRDNHVLSLGDKSMTLTEWAEATGLTRKTIYYRLRQGWSVERTLTTPRT